VSPSVTAGPITTVTAITTAIATILVLNGKGVRVGAVAGLAAGLAVLAIFGSIGRFFTGLRRGKRLGANNINNTPM
jgi:hypothetical protein